MSERWSNLVVTRRRIIQRRQKVFICGISDKNEYGSGGDADRRLILLSRFVEVLVIKDTTEEGFSDKMNAKI